MAGDLPGFVEPAYSSDGMPGRTLGDVLPAVATALGVTAGFHESGLALPPAPAYVVMLVDGLGHELLAEHRAQAPYLHSLLGEGPATCGVPSTTATSLTSLGTALTPGQHGLVGFTSRVPETGELLELAVLGPAGRPAGVAAERDRVRAARGCGGAHQRRQQA